jgi:hypothetical protein
VNPCHSEVHSVQSCFQYSSLSEVNTEQGVSPVFSVWNNFEGRKGSCCVVCCSSFCRQSILCQYCTSVLAIMVVQACLSCDDSFFNNTPIRQLSPSLLSDNCGAVDSGRR